MSQFSGKFIDLAYIGSSGVAINCVLSFIACIITAMSKVLAKGGSPLKFDTSKANIGCFIHTTTPPKRPEYNLYATPFKTKKRARHTRQQQIEFQDKAFLESVVCKILNDADCKGITDLIDSMVFPGPTNAEIENNRETPGEVNEQDEITQVFSDFTPFNKNTPPRKINVFAPNCEQYRILPPVQHHPNAGGLYNYEEKPESATFHTSLLDSTAISSRSEEVNSEMIAAIGYNYGYLAAGNYLYQRQPSQRKRKSGAGQQVQEYKIVPERIEADGRTTLMIRHIPNKYTEEMLFEEIGRNHRMKINFLYLPVDHFNACNVGYAFVNFIHTKFIREFYQEFNGRRWDRFNSEKICELAYARIQGTTNLMDHFNASQMRGRPTSRMNEVKPRPMDADVIKGLDGNADFPKMQDF